MPYQHILVGPMDSTGKRPSKWHEPIWHQLTELSPGHSTTRLQANADMQTCANTLPNHAFFRLGCNIFSTDRRLWQTLDGELMMFDVWYCNLTWTFSTFAHDLIDKHRDINCPLELCFTDLPAHSISRVTSHLWTYIWRWVIRSITVLTA